MRGGSVGDGESMEDRDREKERGDREVERGR